MLQVDSLVKTFGDHRAVDGVSFHIAPGETYGLLGPNGAGKTTTISMICGLLEPDSGSASIGGEPVGPRALAAKRRVGLVPQELAVYPDLTGRENLQFFGRVQGMAKDALSARVDHVLDVVALAADRADDRADEYSGGMQRRLNIAVGLLHEPSLLILDEPTVGVDPQSRNAILESVEALATEGMSVLYTTHYMEEAERLCDRIGVVDAGRVIAEGTRRELLDQLGEADQVRVDVDGDTSGMAVRLGGMEGVVVTTTDDTGMDLAIVGAGQRLPEVLRVVAEGGAITRVEVDEPDLETVFLHLTGKALRA